MKELLNNGFIISLLTSIFTISGMKITELFFEKRNSKNNSYMNANNESKIDNIIHGYYNFMDLLPEIFKQIKIIDDIMAAFYNVISDTNEYNDYVEETSSIPEEDCKNILDRTLLDLRELIARTDRFSLDLLYFDEDSYNKCVEFYKYVLNLQNTEDRNYRNEAEEKLRIFLVTFTKKFSVKNKFDRLDWFTEERFKNVDPYQIKIDRLGQEDMKGRTKNFIS